ncbi:MAG TPA: RNA 2',3'-cyclic phosphodiesterase, partial [candidate division Zixibacteria bacterium]|nr:RNA 2',3'-cyclic phosphodiesterase [candidate division Zixibacteria bacterium]
LSDDVEQFLGGIILDLKQKRGRVKWVASKNIHLTMKFLGETDENKVEAIIESIKSVAAKHKSVECTIDRIGGFPNLRRPRVIWAGIEKKEDNINRLEAIASDIEEEMTPLGFEKESRKFKSHLTLGRVKDNRNLYELTKYLENYRLEPKEILFDKIVLFKSTLTPDGPIYRRLCEAELGGFVFE